jgi:hypothetical protein
MDSELEKMDSELDKLHDYCLYPSNNHCTNTIYMLYKLVGEIQLSNIQTIILLISDVRNVFWLNNIVVKTLEKEDIDIVSASINNIEVKYENQIKKILILVNVGQDTLIGFNEFDIIVLNFDKEIMCLKKSLDM